MTNSTTIRHKWLIISVIFVQWLIGYFDKTAISVLAVPIEQEFGFSKSEMGMVLSGFFLGFAFMVPVGGYLADRFGPRRVLFTVMLLWSVFTGLTAFAWSLASLIVLRALFGAAEGSFPAASSSAVAQIMPVEQRGRAKALLQSGATLGTALGAFLVAWMASMSGWRTPFIIFSVIGVVTSFVFLLVSGPMKAQQKKHDERGVPLKAVLQSKLIWLLAATQFGIGFFAWGLTQWLPSYWVQAKGLQLTTAGLATAIPNFVAFFAMLGVGFLADKTTGKEGRYVAALIVMTMIATSLTYYASSVIEGVIFMGVAQIAMASSATLLAITVLKRMKAGVVGTATGLTNFGQQFAGVVAPTMMGFAIEQAGGAFGIIFALVVGVLGVSLLTSLLIDKTTVGELNTREVK
ncbi:MFS transporter [Brucella pseudogrignonensis]|uniref:MFS transporter n=1 Tax=Brucella pseudogrignonensis TaxID=419475 RepID=A0A7Y3T118_9HYPH|nr:MFS transporter [Brucella pseudogrignonensis]MCM0752640.1 MFS transporter [Brucella pseudogrignonensis]NNV19086.1 MFS transporter [Brucella pseudogrignonensis]